MKRNSRFKSYVKTTLAVVTSFSLLLPFFVMPSHALVTGDGTDEVNEAYHDGLSLQPLSPAFRLETLMKWTPETDPDASLNRATIPLNTNRFKGHQINDLAHPDAKITNAAIINANHDSSPSTGGSDFNIYAFDNWQYIDSLIYWAGTDEGIFALPSPDIVDAAHKNGVPVYATLGFPWGSGQPDSLKELEAMVQQNPDGSFPAADKMIEIAQYFGFDGYFFNQETYGSNQRVANQLNAMLRYMRTKSREMGYPINISWYDAMANNGNVSHQNAINQSNDLWMKPVNHEDDFGVDEFFINYNWQGRVQGTSDYLKSIGRNPFDAYTGFEIQQRSHKTNIDSRTLIGADKRILSSIALYASNSTMGLARDPEDFHHQENILYTGPQGDPTLADDSQNWKGMSRYVVDKSVITGTEFQTSFNSGHGRKWFTDGVLTRDGAWHNRAIQDIMPTWRFWVKDHKAGQARAAIAYDFDDAYNGGNALKIEGNFKAGDTNEVMLYSTKLNVTDTTKVDVVTKTTPNTTLRLGVSFDENYKDHDATFFTLTSDKDGWVRHSVDLSTYSGSVMHALSLQVEAKQAGPIKVNLGQIHVYTNTAPRLAGPSNIVVTEQLLADARMAQFRATWDKVDGAQYYEVYQVNNDGVPVLLGTSTNNHFYADKITRTDANAFEDNHTTIQVITINKDGQRGLGTEGRFEWGVDLNRSEVVEMEVPINVALNAEVTAVSHQNDAEPASKALDGTAQGNSKWASSPKSNGYMDIKLDAPKTIKRWRVEHAEYGGEAKDMNTINFSLHYKNEKGDWILAKQIKNNREAVTDVLLDEPITAQEWKLKIDLAGSSPWQAVRIYEWQMFETDSFPKPNNLLLNQVEAKPQANGIGSLTLKHVPAKTTVHLYRKLEDKKPTQSIRNEKQGTMVLNDFDFSEYDGLIYYTIQPDFSEESFKNSIAFEIPTETKAMTSIHITSDVNEAIEVPFMIKNHENKGVYEGVSTQAGIETELPLGNYTLTLKTLPKGYPDNILEYPFEVKDDISMNQVSITLVQSKSYQALNIEIEAYEKLVRKIYTQASLEKADSVVVEAKALLELETAQEKDYEAMLIKLNDAIDKLEKIHDAEYVKLQERIQELESLDRSVYTEASLAQFDTIYAEAKAMLEGNEASETQYKTIHERLNKALDDLVLKLDTKALDVLIESAKTIDTSLYTSESFATFQEVLENVQTLRNKVSDQTEMDALVKSLQESIDGLKRIRNTEFLEQLIKEADAVNLDLYTESSLIRLHDAHKHARTIAELELSTQQDIDDAAENLKHALSLLERIDMSQDWSGVDELIEMLGELEANRYDETTFKALQEYIEQVNTLRLDLNLSQDEIDEVAEKVQELVLNLRPVKLDQEMIDRLEDRVSEARQLDVTHYTEESFVGLENALQKAETILGRIQGRQFRSISISKPVSQEELNEAVLELETAMDALVRIDEPVDPEEKPEEKPEVKPEEKPEVKPEEKPEVKPEEKPEVKPEEKPEVKPETNPSEALNKGGTEGVISQKDKTIELPKTGVSNTSLYGGIVMLGLGLALKRRHKH
ncbi:discoidin domain-containing protein [Erysipelothrix rhusiopathiae]|nr:discoidin domain-containing protein [Erysipelothrix rhusiopathiae]